MRRAVWSSLSLFVVIGALSSSSWAVERELCGVRLGDKALNLLDKPGYGQPAYIGPLGTISVTSAEQQQAAGAATGGAARSGPSGPSGGMRGGRRGGGGMRGGMRGGRRGGMAVAPGIGTMAAGSDFQTVLTGGRRGGMGGSRGGGMRGGRRGGARGGGARGGGARGGARGGMGTGGVRGRAGAAGVRGPGLYWYYRRPGGAVIVFALSLDGEITAISLSGMTPTPGGRTSRGIGLGHGYMDLIAQYGYPDQSVSSGTVLEMTYVDHGVRFALDSMRVRQIEIGAVIAAEAEAAPTAPEVGPPPAGMSTEELRGYL